MKIYNTLTKSVDEFTPSGEVVSIYSCGPTVYNHAHIGNLTAYIYSDLLTRVVKLAGYQVKRVMNFTDIDDKTIRDSKVTYPSLGPMEGLTTLTRHYEEVFLNDMSAIGNDTQDVTFVRASDTIDAIQELIKKLVAQGVAYIADDGVYFDISKYSETRVYGQLSKIDAPSESRARIDNDEYDKESAQDFALWKKQKDGEPAWSFILDSPIKSANDTVDMTGRPGWHVECSAMSVPQLGQPFDIHTGGIDLIFPHHENEIAQSTAGDQPKTMARYFVHSGHLLVDGAKMAKSKNNFYTLEDIAKRGHSPLEFRLLVLQSHFQSSTNFSWENLTAAHNRLQSWRNLAELRWQTDDTEDRAQQQIITNLIENAKNALFDNLNTPEALKYVDQAVDHLLQNPSKISHQALKNLIKFLDDVLGLGVENATPDISQELKDMITVRQVERASGNYAKSDEIRNALLSNGIEIKDVPDGTLWSRK